MPIARVWEFRSFFLRFSAGVLEFYHVFFCRLEKTPTQWNISFSPPLLLNKQPAFYFFFAFFLIFRRAKL